MIGVFRVSSTSPRSISYMFKALKSIFIILFPIPLSVSLSTIPLSTRPVSTSSLIPKMRKSALCSLPRRQLIKVNSDSVLAKMRELGGSTHLLETAEGNPYLVMVGLRSWDVGEILDYLATFLL